MTGVEEPLIFRCEASRLVGILHRPIESRPLAVLLIVGGPQYRVGSHRQFVLLARHLASCGFPVLRFDYRGMGDSEGADIDFSKAGADVRAALNALAEVTGSRRIAIWGLCDAASAALMHGCSDQRVRGVALVNPWVRQEQTLARTHLRHYYRARVLDPENWRRLVTGRVNVLASGVSLLRSVLKSFGQRLGSRDSNARASGPSFVTSMLEGLEAFGGKVLVILSGDDLTAAEFADTARSSQRWSRALGRDSVVRTEFPEANHTFSKAEWRNDVAVCTAQWLESL